MTKREEGKAELEKKHKKKKVARRMQKTNSVKEQEGRQQEEVIASIVSTSSERISGEESKLPKTQIPEIAQEARVATPPAVVTASEELGQAQK